MSGSEQLDKRLHAVRADLADAALEGRVDAHRFTTGRPMIVCAPLAAMRRRPQADAPLDTQVLHGETLNVFDVADGFAWAQSQTDSYVGYVPLAALSAVPSAPMTHRVATARTFIYPAPDLKQPTDVALPLGAQVRVLSAEGDYARTESGFIFAAHLAPLDHHRKDWVGVAESLIGVPYLWGGRSPLGLDCSALVQLSLLVCGHQAPRDSDMQEQGLGRPLSSGGEELGRGDLVFWKGHVGVLRDEATLLHANAHHMLVASEPLDFAVARIKAKGGGDITSIRRL